MPLEIDALKSWIGRTETVEDTLCAFQAKALTATLDRDDAPRTGEALPPLWHWIYFHRPAKTADLAANGHPRAGEFVPPVPLPRRMFAGARVRFGAPLAIGERAVRTSTIASLQAKAGASGALVFMRVRNEIAGSGGGALVEEQDIVYRGPPAPDATARLRRAPAQALWQRELVANEALLFRYSALIFNAHRIHWDRPYAAQNEGYPGLVVHGQLLATLLADFIRSHTDRTLAAFSFRSVGPVFDGAPFRLCGKPRPGGVDLWIEDERAALAMEARAEFSPGAHSDRRSLHH
jgi:3-methylfumaryl-CoA hydratase